MCSRLSPSSSGYKSQSQRSDATISPSPSPSPVPAMPCAIHAQSSQNSGASPEPRAGDGGQTVMWAVTSISSVPPGSIIMNPQTNQPYTNSDGTIYRFDPENPPKIFAEMHEDVVESIAEVETEAEVVGNPPQSQMEKREEREQTQENLRNKVKCETKRQRCQAKNNGVGSSYVGNVEISVQNSVKNSATSPTMPFTPSPPIQAQPQPQQSCQRQNQQQTQPQASQDCGESLLKTVTSQAASVSSCPHSQTAQPSYLGYTHHPGGAETVYGQPLVYGPAGAVQQQNGALLVSRHPADVAASQQQNNPPPEMVFGQAPHYGNYSMAMQQSAVQSSVSFYRSSPQI